MKKYVLIYTGRAVKDIKKIDALAKKRLAKFFKKFMARPFSYLEKLSDDKLGQYKIRVGNYRIIVDIDKDKMIVLRVGHRKDIYR